MSQDMQVLQKVHNRFDQYTWSELHITDDYFRAINFPEEAEKFVNSFVAKPTSNFLVIVGSYRMRFYNDEESYVWENREYAAIVTLTLERPFNSFFIDDKMFDKESKNTSLFKINFFNANEKINLVTDLYNKVSRKVSDLDEIYDDFLED
ncbi:hypothetical protein [Staphylococcus saprophyticus]|uniref:hypothetical protein n=1 Tax=Staphylococcus saprophyticus TaxID=29385 RepID=UPI00115A9E06|nr:hypothetical protein [Staphylococcus saprophyticus]TQR88739.1 hypothetical protein FMN82_12275 [Staphylococcus saprophyticus]